MCRTFAELDCNLFVHYDEVHFSGVVYLVLTYAKVI